MRSPNHSQVEALLAEQSWLQALSQQLVRDPNAAADLEQETWLAAMQAPPAHLDGPRGWLRTVAQRLAQRKFRGDRARAARERLVSRDEALPTTGRAVVHAKNVKALVEATLALEEPFRETVLLRYFESLQPTEIAERMGVPPSTVRSRLTRAHAKLRRELTGVVEESELYSMGGLAGALAKLSWRMEHWRLTKPMLALGASAMLVAALMTMARLWTSPVDSRSSNHGQPVAGAGVEPVDFQDQGESQSKLAMEQAPNQRQASGSARDDPSLQDATPATATETTGTILAPDGSPIAGAILGVYAAAHLQKLPKLKSQTGDSTEPRSQRVAELRSDARGVFLIPAEFLGARDRNARSTPYFVKCETPGYMDEIESLELGQTIELRPQWRVRFNGIVRDAETHRPIPGVQVHYGPAALATVTDARGEFHFDGVPGYQTRRAQLQHPDYVLAEQVIPLPGPKPPIVELTMSRGVSLELLFVDLASESPVPGAKLFFDEEGTTTRAAGADGRIVLRIPSRGRQTLRGECEGFANFEWSFRSESLPGVGPLQIPMIVPETIRGSVVDGRGEPVEASQVHATPVELPEAMKSPGLPGSLLHTLAGVRTWGPPLSAAKSNAQGRFEVRVLQSQGPWRLSARLGKRYAEPRHVETIEKPLQLVLPDEPLKTSIHGRVVRGGKPWARETSLWLRGPDERLARSQADGQFETRGRANESYELTYAGRSLRRIQLDETGNAISLGDIPLDDLPRLSMHFEWADGTPVAGMRVWLHALQPPAASRIGSQGFPVSRFFEQTDDQGHLDLLLPQAGGYLLRVDDGTSLLTEELRVEEDTTRRIEVAAPQRFALRLFDAETRKAISESYDFTWSSVGWRRPGEDLVHHLRPESRNDGAIEVTCPAGSFELLLRPALCGYQSKIISSTQIDTGPGASPTEVYLQRGVPLELTFAEPLSARFGDEVEFFLIKVSELHLVRGQLSREEQALLAARGDSIHFLDQRLSLFNLRLPPGVQSFDAKGIDPGRYTTVAFDKSGRRLDLQLRPETFEVDLEHDSIELMLPALEGATPR